MAHSRRAWMVKAGNDNELADVVQKNSFVAIGWPEVGNLSGLGTREAIKERYRTALPEHSEQRIGVNAGQLYRFACEMEQGDYVLTYIKASRKVPIGRILGPYEYREEPILDHYPHVRQVEWFTQVSRDDFGPNARNSMGSLLTVFNLDDYLGQIEALATGKATPAEEEEEALPFFDEVKAKADELIADLVSHLDPYDFQDLVAAVLRAMGYRAVSSTPGHDQGVDIIAHPDSLGFERPRIKVQVKHKQSTSGGPDIRAFIGTLKQGENGLFVSSGGFTNDARLAAEHAHEPVTLLDRDGFIRLLLENYETLEAEFKAKVPLRRVWVPAE